MVSINLVSGSVSGCACHDIRGFRVPDDVPETIWLQLSGFQSISGSPRSTMGSTM